MTEPAPRPTANTDRELWRRVPGDYYSDSLHVTQDGKIGINCGGHVIVMDAREWHRRAPAAEQASAALDGRQEPNAVMDCIREIRGDVDDRTLIERLVAMQGYLRHGADLVHGTTQADREWIVALAEGFKRAGCARSPTSPDPEVIKACILTLCAAQEKTIAALKHCSLCGNGFRVWRERDNNGNRASHCPFCGSDSITGNMYADK